MTELTITQQWATREGFVQQPLVASVVTTCNDGTVAHETFEGPDTVSVSFDVEEGAVCTLDHVIQSSAFETESSCDEVVVVEVPTECEFLSVGFNESVPVTSVTGGAILIAGFLALAYRYFNVNE